MTILIRKPLKNVSFNYSNLVHLNNHNFLLLFIVIKWLKQLIQFFNLHTFSEFPQNQKSKFLINWQLGKTWIFLRKKYWWLPRILVFCCDSCVEHKTFFTPTDQIFFPLVFSFYKPRQLFKSLWMFSLLCMCRLQIDTNYILFFPSLVFVLKCFTLVKYFLRAAPKIEPTYPFHVYSCVFLMGYSGEDKEENYDCCCKL